MTKTQVNQIVNGNEIYISSNGNKATFYTFNKNFIQTNTDIDFQYQYPICLKDWKLKKEQLKNELLKAKSISVDDSVLIGKMNIKFVNSPLPFELWGNKKFYNLTDFNIGKMAKYASTDENRYFMNGVFFSENGDIVATDARILALQKTRFKFDNFEIHREVIKLFEKSKWVHLEYYENKQVVITDEKKSVITTCMDATFPSYQRVIPNYSLVKGKVDFDFRANKSLIQEVATKQSPRVCLFENKIYCGNYEVGSTDLNLSYPIVFNANYLDYIAKDCSGNCDISGGKIEKACVFGDDSFKVICMPNTINSDILPDMAKNKIA